MDDKTLTINPIDVGKRRMPRGVKILLYILLSIAIIFGVVLLVFQLPVFGDQSNSNHALISKSANYKDGKFWNLIETPQMADDATLWKLLSLKADDNVSPSEILPSVKRTLKSQVVTGDPQVTWFGHSTLMLQFAGKTILIDPVFSERASPFQFMGPKRFPGTDVYSTEDLPSIDYVLISHDHYDHLDYNTIKELDGKTSAFYVPLGVGAHLRRWGVAPTKITELDWWQEAHLNADMLLAFAPARHFSGRTFEQNTTLWGSFVLKSKDHSIYLSGDSGFGPHFKEIGNKYGPFDITFLECGQYNKLWPYIHMAPEETAQAHLDLKGKLLMPIHWGKFPLAMHAWKEPVERLFKKATELNLQVVTPMIGEQLVVGKTVQLNKWWETRR